MLHLRMCTIKVKACNLNRLLILAKLKVYLLYLIGIGLVVSGLVLFVPGISSASNRLVNFNKEFIAPPKFSFQVMPGNSQITKGDDLLITVKVNGAKLKNISLSNEIRRSDKF